MNRYCVELSYTVPEEDVQRILHEYDRASQAPESGVWATSAGITVAVQIEVDHGAARGFSWKKAAASADIVASDLILALSNFWLGPPWRALVINLDGLEADVREARRRSDLSPLFIKPGLSDDEVWDLFHELGSN